MPPDWLVERERVLSSQIVFDFSLFFSCCFIDFPGCAVTRGMARVVIHFTNAPTLLFFWVPLF